MSSSWLKEKYFRHKTEFGFNNKWVFSAKFLPTNFLPTKFLPTKNKGAEAILDLLQCKWFKPSRHVMIRNTANPDDPNFTEYFKQLDSIRFLSKRFSILKFF